MQHRPIICQLFQIEACGPYTDSWNNSSRQPKRNLSSLLHCRCCNPETGWNSKISSQEFKSKETCCHSIHISWKEPGTFFVWPNCMINNFFKTMNRMMRLMKVPDQTSIPGLRKMELKDCKQACKLLTDYLKVNIMIYVRKDVFIAFRNFIWRLYTPKRNSSIGSYHAMTSSIPMWSKTQIMR